MSRSKMVIVAISAAMMATSAKAALLYSNDFDSAASLGAGVTGGVSGAGVTGTANGATYAASGWSGNHLRNETTGNPASFTNFSFGSLAAHTSVSASFVLGFLDSWDGYGSFPSGDNLEIWIDGVQVAQLTSNQASGAGPDFDGATLIAFGVQADSRFFFSDTLVNAGTIPALTFAHSASTLTLGLRASGVGWQGGTDESFGIDNVNITYNAGAGVVPEPATWALMIGGFGMAGGALRRRRALTAA